MTTGNLDFDWTLKRRRSATRGGRHATVSALGSPVMRAVQLALAMLAVPCLGTSEGDASEGRWGYRGVWAGERMHCDGPDSKLHVYGRKSVRHPAIYEDDTAYACRIIRIDGRRPVWTLQLRCTTSGIGQRPRRLNLTQTLTLRDGGTRLAVMRRSTPEDNTWSEELFRCRALRHR